MFLTDHGDNTWGLRAMSAEAVSEARHEAEKTFANWGVDEDTTSSLLLVVSELVTNAVEHAVAPVTLALVQEDTAVRVAVTDGGPAETDGEWISSCEDDEHGRGSGIVDMLAEDMGRYEESLTRVTYWATVGVS